MRVTGARLRRVVKTDLPIEFGPQQLTSYGGLELLRRYFRRLDLPHRIRQAFSGSGLASDYGAGRLVLLVIALFVVGARRLEHLRYLAHDPLVARLCGLIPTDRTVVNWLKQFTQEAPRVTRLDRRSHPGTESRESDQGAFRQGYADSLIPSGPSKMASHWDARGY